ncbi:Uncharacterised protein [Salmonella enterica subsp. arizonae]|uniref:Uncharacterized protein n=1 Tax=Salmonella enterica subsp. arizonae TaxID=59203 RepID=A0A447R1F4_SALER|nr:Uncharacterised protein [Salmonella enterica subsp. arizonae]
MSMTATLSLKKLEEHFGIQDQLSNADIILYLIS